MSVEEKVKREILIKELTRDELLAHCFIEIEDSEKLYCRAYLGVACRVDRPDSQWGFLPMNYRMPIARFVIESIWSNLSEEDQGEWLDIVEKWTALVHKKKGLTHGDAARAMILTKNTRAMGKELGVSYDVAHRSILPKLVPLEKLEKLQPVFDTRSAHQRTLEHLQEPKRVSAVDVLGCRGHVGGDCEGARALLYEWLDLKEYPGFDMDYLAALAKSRHDYFEKHDTLEGWRSVIPSAR